MFKLTSSYYSAEIVQDTIRFMELYARMGRQLCESLMVINNIGVVDANHTHTNFEELIGHIDELEDIAPLWYKGQYWDIDPHGDHCLFVSNSGLQVEVNIYDSNRIDAAFFSLFVHHLPAAQVFVRVLAPADFGIIVNLLDYMTEQGHIIRCDGTHFKLPPDE